MTLAQQLADIEEALKLLDTNNRGDLPEISRLTTLQNELLAQQALEVRTAVQEEKVSAIILPYNFSEVFDDERANDIIIEVIRDFQRQAYAEHNAELTEMATAHRDELRAAADRELQLKRQNDELQNENSKHLNEIESLANVLAEVRRQESDALSKRDAAVAKAEGLELLLSEKEEHINKLREEIAIGAKAAVNVTNISPSDRLALLVQESKNAKVKSAIDIALENPVPFRGKVITDPNAVAELHTPGVQPFQPINQASDSGYQLVTGSTPELPANDQVTPSEENVYSGRTVDQGCTSENGQTLAEAFKRIEALEAKLGA